MPINALGQAPENPGAAKDRPAHESEAPAKTDGDQHQPQQSPMQPPSVEKKGAAASSERREKHEEYYQKEDLKAQQAMAKATDSIVLLTAVQIFFGVVATGLLFWTLYYTRKATYAAIGAANASTLSANVAIALELPILRASPPNLIYTDRFVTRENYTGGVVNDGRPTEHSAISEIEIHNRGRTAAFPHQVHVGWTVADRLPDAPEYPSSTSLDTARIFNPNSQTDLRVFVPINLTDEQIQRTRNGAALWFYIAIEYWDFIDKTHTAKFCWVWREVGMFDRFRFHVPDDAPTAYTTKR